MEISEVRKRVRGAITAGRTAAQERRTRVDAASRDYETFLADRAVPLFHQVAAALVAEGLRYHVFTPAGSVRLASESGADDYIELVLDTTGEEPQVLGRSSRGRGRRLVTSERPIRPGSTVPSLTEEDVLNFLVEELGPFVAR